MRVPVKKSALSIKCTSCNKLRPLSSFPRHDMRILQKQRHHVALCNSCRLICRNCGQVILKTETSPAAASASSSSTAATMGGGAAKAQPQAFPRMSGIRQKMTRELAISNSEYRKQHQTSSSGVLFGNRRNSSSSSGTSDSDTDDGNDAGGKSGGHICDKCAERAELASTNVFYRFPMLRFRQCPFGTEKYRRIISNEIRRARR